MKNVEHWKIFTKPYLNASRIFPTRQRYIAEMIDACYEDKNIIKAIVFGSSITSACNPWSDIDIYFEQEVESDVLPSIHSDEVVFDKWTNFTCDEKLKAEIEKKGVVFYRRDEF